MSRGNRFSRRGGGGSRQDEVGRTIYERVDALMENRWKYLNQFDAITDFKQDLFRYAMRWDEWQAWGLLEQNKKFRSAMSYTNQITVMNFEVPCVISFTRPPEELYVAIPVLWGNLPEALQETVHNWMIRSEAYRWEYITIRERVKALTLLCTTPGQIERVWPELLGFMPGHVVDSRFVKRAKSPYPDGVWEKGWELVHPDERKLKENFRPETLEWFNDALTEALILPLQKWDEQLPFPNVSFSR